MITHPYKEVLQEFTNGQALLKIERRDKPDVSGSVSQLKETYVILKLQPRKQRDDVEPEYLHLAYDDIRGVTPVGWDYSNI